MKKLKLQIELLEVLDIVLNEADIDILLNLVEKYLNSEKNDSERKSD